jgi:hypothetical protein
VAKTIEQLVETQKRASDAFERARNNFHIANNALIAARKAEEAKIEMTLAYALEGKVDSGWNERGAQYLQNLSWKGEWKGTGLRSNSSHWNNTHQHQLTVYLDARDDDAKLATLEKLMNKVVSLYRPGAVTGTLKLTSKGASVDASTLRVFDITEHSLKLDGDYQIGQISETEWVVYDLRHINTSYGRALETGTLLECLRYIRDNLSHTGGDYNED